MLAGIKKGERDVLQLFDVSVTPETGGTEVFLIRILARCAAWFEASGASIFLQESRSGEFRLRGQFGVDSLIPEDATIRPGIGVAGACIESGQPMLVIDPTAEPMLRHRITTRRGDLSSSMVVPLIDLERRCIGVLNLSRRDGKRPFDDSDLSVASSLGRHVALATTNARLLAESRAARLETESVLNSIGASVWVIDGELGVTSENPAATKDFGNSVGAHWQVASQSMPESLRDATTRSVESALNGVPFRTSAEDNQLDRAWTIFATPLPSGGAVLTVEDASEHRRASREFSRMKRLAEIGQMTAAIAHEIRNPLTGIRSAANLIVSAPEHARDFAEIIEEEVLKLNSLCDDFLEFARPLALRLSEVDLRAVANSVSQSVRHEFLEAGVHLSVEIALQVPIIEGDSLRIEQVMRNLLRNSMQACQVGGTVQFAIRPNEFEIADNGAGMSEETVEKLFTPFFTTKPQGTGLGMSNVRKIIEAHGADIEVRSEVGVGTSITVHFRESM